MNRKQVDPSTLSSLVLAFMGDAVIETYVRDAVISGGKAKIHALHEQTVGYVSARAQSAFLHELIDQDFLTDSELDIVRHGRNAKSHSVPRNTDVQTYNFSTGFEALMGYLHFQNKQERIDAIMSKMFTDHSVEGARA